MEESWKDIIGYEGLYQISNFGNVKSMSRIYYSGSKRTSLKVIDEYIMQPRLTKTGYFRTTLTKKGVHVEKYIHRLVAEYFLLNPFNFREVNHKDEVKANNNYLNLEWCSHYYNCNYGTRNKRLSEINKVYRKKNKNGIS